MSTWKQLRIDADKKAANRQPPVETDADDALPPAPQVEVTSLEIDFESEVGGDPYNRTGQFCVPTFDKREKD